MKNIKIKILAGAIFVVLSLSKVTTDNVTICYANTLSDNGFVVVSDVIPDIVLDIRYNTNYNFVGERIDGYEEPIAILTNQAAQALLRASEELKGFGYQFKIYDAYRPQDAVNHFVRWAYNADDIRMKSYFYPNVPKNLLFSEGYIARYSGHSRGSTVDLTLYDVKNQMDVDMGGTFDYFGVESHTFYQQLTEEQKNNRMLLRKIMMKYGFYGIDTEWWHFTLVNEPYKNTYFNFYVKRP